jgi:hypothetical protein
VVAGSNPVSPTVPVEHFTPTDDSDGTVALLECVGDDIKSIHDLLTEQVDAAQPRSKTTAIDLWLRDILSDGPVPSSDLEAMAIARGYSPDRLRGAGDRLGAKRTKVGEKWMTTL